MIFNYNILPTRKISYKKINFASFANGINTNYSADLLPIQYSINTYNFNYNNGALKDGIGLAPPYVRVSLDDYDVYKGLYNPTNLSILGVWLYTKWDTVNEEYIKYIIIYCSDGYIYTNLLYTVTTTFTKITNLHFSSIPRVVNYKLNGEDILIIVGQNEGMYTFDGTTASSVSSAPKIKNMVLHYERLYVTVQGESKSVWFSDDLDPTNFNISSTEGGFITMADDRGTLNQIISFNDYIYVFRDFGIARITAFANQDEFSVNQLFVSNSKIYENTIKVCGDKIMFLAKDGVYAFNGVSTSKVSLNIESMFDGINNINAVAGYFEGNYYIACRLSFPDSSQIGCEAVEGYINNAVLKINCTTGELNILRGYDVRFINEINDGLTDSYLFCCAKLDNYLEILKFTNDGAVDGLSTYKYWKSPTTNFGLVGEYKLLKEIHIKNNKNITIKLEIDGNTFEYEAEASNKINIIRPYKKGKNFSMQFICQQNNIEISNPQVVVGFYG